MAVDYKKIGLVNTKEMFARAIKNIQVLCFKYVKSTFCYHFARIILNFLSFLDYFY